MLFPLQFIKIQDTMFWKEVLPTVKINQQIPGHLLTGKLPQAQPPPCSLKCLSFHNGQICVTSPNMSWLQACSLPLQGLFLWWGCSPYCLGPCLAVQGLQPCPGEWQSFPAFQGLCSIFSTIFHLGCQVAQQRVPLFVFIFPQASV